MTFAVFAKTHYPLKHSSSPHPKVLDISKDLKPGDILYYHSLQDNRKIYGKFLNYDTKYVSVYGPNHLEVWGIWYGSTPRTAWISPSRVHLHTGEIPADLLNI